MIIFSPGPANISERVRRALLASDICHRDSEFSALLGDVRKKILQVCGLRLGYRSIVLGGSGTLAIESIIASLGGYAKKVLIISNGVYGERAAAIARQYGIGFEEMRFVWGESPDLDRVNRKLKERQIGAVYLVHHETTAGLVNPLREIAQIARKNGKMVLVDGISSIAGEELKIGEWGIDAISGVANKCIRGVAGVSFVVASDRFIAAIRKCRSGSFYAHLIRYLDAEEAGQPLFTPPVQVLYAFREALRELLEEGVRKRICGYRLLSRQLRDGLKKLHLRLYFDKAAASNTLTVVRLPEGATYASLHSYCKRKGFVIYTSQGKLADITFRLGVVGKISKKDIQRFLSCLAAAVSQRRRRG